VRALLNQLPSHLLCNLHYRSIASSIGRYLSVRSISSILASTSLGDISIDSSSFPYPNLNDTTVVNNTKMLAPLKIARSTRPKLSLSTPSSPSHLQTATPSAGPGKSPFSQGFPYSQLQTPVSQSKPRLSLSTSQCSQPTSPAPLTPLRISTNNSGGLAVPTFSNSSLHSPISSALTPTTKNTLVNQRGLSTYQAPTYSYPMNQEKKSILKRRYSYASAAEKESTKPTDGEAWASQPSTRRKIQFKDEPVVHAITPINWEDAHGERYVKKTREMRWAAALKEVSPERVL
jgi:hypothetical protein